MSGKVAVSDLHSRLDFLVAYSSQLVFVASDDLQFQQSTLQSFIAQQPENLEVAFLKGDPDRSEADYRKEICRQVLHKAGGQFDDSLRNVLQDFEGVDNPILICLCASQHLPDVLLDEMWQLVLFARTLNKNLHVNVVLFGDSIWAVEAKKRLPVDEGNQPILLSTEFASAEIENSMLKDGGAPELSELDAMIANKRAAFAERVEARTKETSPKQDNQSLIQTRKFQVIIGIVFFATFAALVSWFYPRQTETETPAPTPVESVSTVEADDKPEVERVIETAEPLLDETEPVQSVATAESVESVESVETNDVTELAREPQIEPTVDQILVTQWDNSETKEPLDELDPAQTPIIEDETINNQAEQLVAEPLTSIDEIRGLQNPSISEHPLNIIEKGKFLIQISSTSNLQAAEAFIQDNALQDSTWVYTTKRFGGSWFVVVYKTPFQSQDEARYYIPTLSGSLKTSAPFVKSIEKIQEEIAVAN